MESRLIGQNNGPGRQLHAELRRMEEPSAHAKCAHGLNGGSERPAYQRRSGHSGGLLGQSRGQRPGQRPGQKSFREQNQTREMAVNRPAHWISPVSRNFERPGFFYSKIYFFLFNISLICFISSKSNDFWLLKNSFLKTS